MKKCNKCNEIKPKEEFNKCNRNKDGLQTCCRECQKKSQKAWRKKNPNYDKEYCKEWRKENSDNIKEYQKIWREENPQKKKEWCEKNPQKKKEYQKKWCEKNHEKMREYQKKFYDKKCEEAIKRIYDNFVNDTYPNENIQYGVIYGVHNIITDRWYIGQTTRSFDIRYSGNFFKNKLENISGEKRTVLLNDLEQYGENSFEIYEVLDIAYSLKELDEKEVYYIDYYKAYEKGYNSNRGYINGRDTLYT